LSRMQRQGKDMKSARIRKQQLIVTIAMQRGSMLTSQRPRRVKTMHAPPAFTRNSYCWSLVTRTQHYLNIQTLDLLSVQIVANDDYIWPRSTLPMYL
jgi:hypothetical protein